MRTYTNIVNEYLTWYSKKSGNEELLPEYYLNESFPREELDIRIAKVWKEVLELCYKPVEGIFWFTKFILGDMTYAGYPEPIHFNSLWWDWTKKSSGHNHITIICARQHGKTSYWSVITPIYRTSMFEQYNILIESASEDQANSILSQVVRIIENNEFLLSKKSQSAKWSTSEISYNGGKIVARGVGSEVRGGTYDLIVNDDILRSDNKLSDEDIERFIDEELEPMILVRRGQMVIIGTRKSVTDIFTTIQERIEEGVGGWVIHTYPALDEQTKRVLCPDRFTYEQLMAKKSLMGQRKFDKEFMCVCMSHGSQLFQVELRKRAMELGIQWILYSKAKSEDTGKWFYYMGVDVARAGTATADYTVAFVLAYNPQTQERRIVWVWRERGLKIAEQVERIAEISRNFNNPPVLVEQNNIGQDFIDVMVDNYNLHVESFTTGGRGQGKEDLIRFLISSFENEKIIMPTGNSFSKEQMGILDNELDRFVVEITRAGNEVMKGSGHSKDDMVMALALANKCSQAYGYTPFAFAVPKKDTTELERFAITGNINELINMEVFK